MSDYFGILKHKKLNELSSKGLADVIFESDLFYVAKNIKADFIEGHIQIKDGVAFEPNVFIRKDISESLYNFLKSIFREEIDQPFIKYFKEFNETVFGLDILDRKKIALNDFKELYKKVKVIDLDILHKRYSESGIEHIDSFNKMTFLKGRQNAIKDEVSNIRKPYVFEYLSGDEIFFEKENAIKFKEIKELVEFESRLKILISLNDLYRFEDDFEFSRLGQLKDVYKKYTHIFNNFEVFVYVHQMIESFTLKTPANIYSLYDALLQMHYINKRKTDFFKYVNKEYQYDLTKIISYKEGDNLKHDERVKKITNDLKKYSGK